MIEIEKKITNHGHDKYIATPEFNTLTSEHFASKANIANKFSKKIYYCCFRKKDRFWWKAKNIPNGAKYSSSGTFQNYLVFIPMKKYIKYFLWR